jgi:nucleotide-binding universal stress UspA family protein
MPDLQPIVVGLDFSEGSEAALVRAADLAERLHARLHLLYAKAVAAPIYGDGDPGEGSTEHYIREFAARALGGKEALDVIGPTAVVRRSEAPADAIVRYAAEVDAGLVVVGTHGRRGVSHLLAGSVAEEVIRRAPCPVVTVPNAVGRTAPGPKAPVLVPIDFSDVNRDALATARLIAEGYGAPVDLVHVVGEPGSASGLFGDVLGMGTALDVVPGVGEGVEPKLRRLDADVRGSSAARYHVCEGRPAREIVALAEEIGAGLIVMATHGLTGWEHALIGSVTEQTLRHAPCPVLSLRRADDEEPPEA